MLQQIPKEELDNLRSFEQRARTRMLSGLVYEMFTPWYRKLWHRLRGYR